MNAITRSPSADFRLIEPMPVKDFDRKLDEVEKKVSDLAKVLFAMKKESYWRGADKAKPVRNTAHCLDVAQLQLTELQSDLLRLEESSSLFERMCKVVDLQICCYRFRTTIMLIDGVARACFEGVYESVSSMADTLLAVLDPKKSDLQKVDALEAEFEGKHLAIANDSPRDIGLELLHLFQLAIQSVLSHAKGEKLVQRLDAMLKVVEDKIQHVTYCTAWGDKNHPTYPNLPQTELTRVEQLITNPKEKFAFGQAGLLTVLKVFSKQSECEAYGLELEQQFGVRVAGLSKACEEQFNRVVAGHYSPETAKNLTNELDLYGHVYQVIKEDLERKRQKIYQLTPDSYFKELLNYAYGLRYELREIAFMLDLLREFSTHYSLQLFRVKAAFGEYAAVRKKSRASVLSLFTLRREQKALAALEAKHQQQYKPFLDAIRDSINNTVLRTFPKKLETSKDEELVWNFLFLQKQVPKQYDTFFLKKVLHLLFVANDDVPDSKHLLLLYMLRHDESIRQRLVEHAEYGQMVKEFDELCAKWNMSDLLQHARNVILAPTDGRQELLEQLAAASFVRKEQHEALTAFLRAKLQ